MRDLHFFLTEAVTNNHSENGDPLNENDSVFRLTTNRDKACVCAHADMDDEDG